MAKKRKTRGREPKDRKPKKPVLGGTGKKPASGGGHKAIRAGAKSPKRSGKSRGKPSGVRKGLGAGVGGVRKGGKGGSRKVDGSRKKDLRRRSDASKPRKKVVKGKSKKPVRKISRGVPSKKSPRKLPKRPQRKLPKKPSRKLPKRPVRKQPRKPPRKPVRKQPREPKRKKPVKPVLALPSASVEAERRIQNILIEAMQEGARRIPDLTIGVKSFVNADRTVDGEITFSNIPAEWREKEGLPFMAEFLSEVLQAIGVLKPGDEEGGYYITAGCRFGPRDESEMAELAELYKRFRGFLQISAHYTSGQATDAIQNQVAALRDMIRLLMEKRGTPPVTILVRFTWTPDGSRPERFEGEKGSG